MENQICEVDKAITKAFNNLDFRKLKFVHNCSFVLNHNVKLFNEIINDFKGVYLFELELSEHIPDAEVFRAIWAKNKLKNQYSPKIIKSRLPDKAIPAKWLPLYLGISKNVNHRIKEHLDLDINKRTYAMKLKSIDDLYGINFKVSIIRLDIVNYNTIMPYIEKELRKIYSPILGKQ